MCDLFFDTMEETRRREEEEGEVLWRYHGAIGFFHGGALVLDVGMV